MLQNRKARNRILRQPPKVLNKTGFLLSMALANHMEAFHPVDRPTIDLVTSGAIL
jgi:hypothetical protein